MPCAQVLLYACLQLNMNEVISEADLFIYLFGKTEIGTFNFSEECLLLSTGKDAERGKPTATETGKCIIQKLTPVYK